MFHSVGATGQFFVRSVGGAIFIFLANPFSSSFVAFGVNLLISKAKTWDCLSRPQPFRTVPPSEVTFRRLPVSNLTFSRFSTKCLTFLGIHVKKNLPLLFGSNRERSAGKIEKLGREWAFSEF